MLPSHPEPEQGPETVFSNLKELEVGKKKKLSKVWSGTAIRRGKIPHRSRMEGWQSTFLRRTA